MRLDGKPVLVANDVRLETLRFERDEVVLAGPTDRQELSAAFCTIVGKEPFRCRWRDLGLDARLFEVVGADAQGSVIIASRSLRVGENGLRACLFVYADHLASPAETCRLTHPVKEVYGSRPESFYAIAPDRRHVAVLTSALTWAVVPTSVLPRPPP